MTQLEIERKFRLAPPPPLALFDAGTRIEQGYLFTDGGEARVRRRGEAHTLTVKGDGTLMREEWEVAIPAWVFATLWAQTMGRRITKTRYTRREAGVTYELDVFDGALAGLVLLECEFATHAAASVHMLPDWASKAVEVTTDPGFKNKALARQDVMVVESRTHNKE